MIQRKQSLFLFQLVFFSIALMLIPSVTVRSGSSEASIMMVPINHPEFSSSMGHITAIVINFVALVLTFVTVFLFKHRELQIKLCYLLIFFWLVLSLMIAFCPFAESLKEPVQSSVNYLMVLLGGFAILAATLAIRFIKKDIELLKSADRIR
jgi:hypothetical protein